MEGLVRDQELEAIKLRHIYADGPSERLDGLKRISLVYSGMGKQAHDDRGALLAEIDRLRCALGDIASGLSVLNPYDLANETLNPPTSK